MATILTLPYLNPVLLLLTGEVRDFRLAPKPESPAPTVYSPNPDLSSALDFLDFGLQRSGTDGGLSKRGIEEFLALVSAIVLALATCPSMSTDWYGGAGMRASGKPRVVASTEAPKRWASMSSDRGPCVGTIENERGSCLSKDSRQSREDKGK